jgi:hypothetical protein
MIEPGEMHDGQADSVGGFAYTMLYLPKRLARDAALDAVLQRLRPHLCRPERNIKATTHRGAAGTGAAR